MPTRWLDVQALTNQYPNRADFVAKLLKAVVQSHGDTTEKLDKAISANDIEQLIFLAHSLKGVCTSVLAISLSQLASEAENAARGKKANTIELAKKLNVGLQEFLNEIRTHIALGK